MESLFQGTSVESNRIIYTPSGFARTNLLHLQEAGRLQALAPHTNSRKGLLSYLIFLVVSGCGNLVYDGQSYSLSPASCVFIDCRKAYSHCSSKEQPWNLKWVHFYAFNMNGIYEKYVARGGRPVFTPADPEAFSRILDNLYSLAESDDYIRDMKINEKITGLLTLIMAESWHPEGNIRTGLKTQSLQQVKAYLEEHYQERIDLDRLARRFYINKFYLTRVFREQFGTTVVSYLNQVRTTQAKRLLRFSDYGIETIGKKVGIEEPGYFSRVFKKIEGITPGEYRKMWQNPTR